MKLTILIITSLILTSCGGHYGKKLEEHHDFSKTRINFGTDKQELIKAYLVSNEKSGANYSNFDKESDIYPFFDFNRINSKPQLICTGTLPQIANCTGHFKPPYKKMTGIWHVNQHFNVEPWGLLKHFVSGMSYVQLIQYKGKRYETAVMYLDDFNKLLIKPQKLNIEETLTNN